MKLLEIAGKERTFLEKSSGHAINSSCGTDGKDRQYKTPVRIQSLRKTEIRTEKGIRY